MIMGHRPNIFSSVVKGAVTFLLAIAFAASVYAFVGAIKTNDALFVVMGSHN
jgi:hypothetical protein